MSEKPIIFSTPMVKAILDGQKTMTRRVVKPQPETDTDGFWHWKDCQWADGGLGCPQSGIDDYAPLKPGDILWVRETFQAWGKWQTCITNGRKRKHFVDMSGADYPYRFFDEFFEPFSGDTERAYYIRPSLFLPRAAARLFLEVNAVRIERLWDITNKDAEAEGVEEFPIFNDFDGYEHVAVGVTTSRQSFQILWDSLNAKRGYSWESNPWCWVYEFRRVSNG